MRDDLLRWIAERRAEIERRFFDGDDPWLYCRIEPDEYDALLAVVEASERRRQARLALDAGHAAHSLVDYPSSRMERLAGAYLDAIDSEDTALRTLLAQITPPDAEGAVQRRDGIAAQSEGES